MTDVEAKLQRFEQQLQQFAKDLDVLQRLNSINDTNTQLNKIRYIAEGILHNLCVEHDIGWGKGEPTLERMIGPLRAADVIPAPISSHFRSIQSTSSPGSHYQKDKLTESHAQIALLALVDILEWYVTYTGVKNSQASKSHLFKNRKGITKKVLFVVGICMVVFGYIWQGDITTGKRHPVEKLEQAQEVILQFQKQVSARHFLMSQLRLQIKNIETTDQQHYQQTLENYRNVLQEYNMERNIYRLNIQNIFGKELYLWEREIHNELFYAGRNLECLIRKDGEKKQLILQTEKHLKQVQDELADYVLFSHQLLDRTQEWPVPVRKIKTPIDSQLENPCPKE